MTPHSIALWLALVTHACAIPDVDDIHLAACIESCSDDSDMCLDGVLAYAELCTGPVSDSDECSFTAMGMLADCLVTWADCATECIRALEREIK